jgi:hypothetical protein
METTEGRSQLARTVEDLPSTTFSGRRFTREQLKRVIETVRDCARLSRKELAETICEHLDWCNPRGANKTGCALRLLEALEAFGLCTLPRKREAAAPSRSVIDLNLAEKEPREPIDESRASLGDLLPIELVKVESAEEHAAFNASIEAHHYLGYAQPHGNRLGYFIVSQRTGQRLGCMLYASSAAWQLPARDLWIGWSKKQREKSRYLVLTQQRFLLFPWVRVQNLASHVLSFSQERIVSDWTLAYGYRPVLLETFVDSAFDGASYKAANWELVGHTQRRAQESGAAKAVFVRPLSVDFRQALTADLTRRAVARRDREAVAGATARHRIDPAFVDLWRNVLRQLQEVAATFDARWQKRQRVLDTQLLMLFVFRLISAKNRQGYGTTSDELWENIRALGETWRGRRSPSPAAWCEARKKLDESAFKELNSKIVEVYAAQHEAEHLWFGHRIFAVDGSKINLPPKLLDAGYKPAGGSGHYAQGLLSCLYRLSAKLPVDFDFVAHGDERRCAKEHLAALRPGDVVVYDRGYFSYAMLQDHVDAGVHAVFRLQESSAAAINDFMAGSESETLATLYPSKSTLCEIAKARPELMITPQRLRLVKYGVDGATFYLGTTLLETTPEQISAAALSDLYHSRWGLEELYKVSKRIMLIEEFHSEYERGIKQELFAHLVLITMNRLFANEADRVLNPPPSNDDGPRSTQTTHQQTNFKSCIHVVGRNLECLLLDAAHVGEASASAYTLIPRRRQTVRPGRHYQRRSLRPESKWHASGKKERDSSKAVSKPIPLRPTADGRRPPT